MVTQGKCEMCKGSVPRMLTALAFRLRRSMLALSARCIYLSVTHTRTEPLTKANQCHTSATFVQGRRRIIDIEYNKRLHRQRPCLEDDFNGGSNNIVQSNKSV